MPTHIHVVAERTASMNIDVVTLHGAMIDGDLRSFFVTKADLFPSDISCTSRRSPSVGAGLTGVSTAGSIRIPRSSARRLSGRAALHHVLHHSAVTLLQF